MLGLMPQLEVKAVKVFISCLVALTLVGQHSKTV